MPRINYQFILEAEYAFWNSLRAHYPELSKQEAEIAPMGFAIPSTKLRAVMLETAQAWLDKFPNNNTTGESHEMVNLQK